MANVELKQPIIQEIAGQVEGAQSVVVIDYRGINVADDTELRRAFREEGIVYKVYKNTMMKRAFEGTDFEKLDPVLEGPSAIAISKDDATAPARLIAKYAKKMESLEIKAGIVEGDFYDAAAMQQIASIPSREELLGKLLGSLQSPIANFARVLDQLAEKGGYEAIAPEEETSAEEPAAEEPAAEEPAAEEPAAEEPAAEDTDAEETADKKGPREK
ncbi:MAG: 50S ribosomal protein L10, partial [Lachnospiraceae bacterium]|nr:50S ribosomal protein L10 [Lachnospiraceae bacterium]